MGRFTKFFIQIGTLIRHPLNLTAEPYTGQEVKPVPLEPGHDCGLLRTSSDPTYGYLPGDVQLDGEPGSVLLQLSLRASLGNGHRLQPSLQGGPYCQIVGLH